MKPKHREPLNLSDPTMEVLLKMTEGNPGAITVLMQMLEREEDGGLFCILHLDDMNIRGSQIWVAWKDHCEQDMDVFLQKIKDRDQGMIDTVNAQCYHPEMENADYLHKAVKSGASFTEMSGQKVGIRGMGL